MGDVAAQNATVTTAAGASVDMFLRHPKVGLRPTPSGLGHDVTALYVGAVQCGDWPIQPALPIPDSHCTPTSWPRGLSYATDDSLAKVPRHSLFGDDANGNHLLAASSVVGSTGSSGGSSDGSSGGSSGGTRSRGGEGGSGLVVDGVGGAAPTMYNDTDYGFSVVLPLVLPEHVPP
jgi:hypothetical protein